MQVIGDGKGGVRHLWERECSIQRFHKVVEFAPSSIPSRELVAEVIYAALRMAKQVNYSSLGTFEFLVHSSPPEFYFLEVNPRLQVEHVITESVAMGLDLVKLQLLLAQGYPLSSLPLSNLPEDAEIPPPIQSLQFRVTAEDASNEWSLSVGRIESFRLPAGKGVRVDTHLIPSHPVVIGTYLISLIAKTIVAAPTWEDVVMKAKRALADTYIEGIKTNLDALRGIVASEDFAGQTCDTQRLERRLPSVLESGRKITTAISNKTQLTTSSARPTVTAASNVLPRKGDAWSVSLTPGSDSKFSPAKPTPSHSQLIRVLRNEFPASLTAQITYTTSTASPTSYLMTLASTTASFGSIASASTHRRGDTANPNHITIPFAGKLVELLVDEADEIKKGQVVAVVQQMKMELEIRASRGGRVVWIYEGEEGEEGDDVGEGVLVVELVGIGPRL